MRTLLSLLPAAVIMILALSIIRRRKDRDQYWWGAAATAVALAIKLLTIWLWEPFAIFIPVVGVLPRMLTAPLLLPEGLIWIPFKLVPDLSGSPGFGFARTVSVWAAGGSLVIGLFVGLARWQAIRK